MHPEGRAPAIGQGHSNLLESSADFFHDTKKTTSFKKRKSKTPPKQHFNLVTIFPFGTSLPLFQEEP
jgi:hypothetical protein